jgi:hypothetical protein
MFSIFRRVIIFLFLPVIFSCSGLKTLTTAPGIKAIKYLGVYEIPYNYQFKNTVVGGLSGIDYDKKNNLYYLVSDDRSDKNPARFYIANLFIGPAGIDSLVFLDSRLLLQPDGRPYPGIKEDKYSTPDPESIRYHAKNGTLTWSSEGERIVSAREKLLINPALITIDINGRYIDSFFIPVNLRSQPLEKGPRRNGAFEGISFADDYKTLYVQLEEPLLEDGPKADLTDNNAYTRLLKFDVATKTCVAQYAYRLEPVAYKPVPDTGFKINGVSEILYLGRNKLLMMERSFSTGILPCTIKLFVADLGDATDITNLELKNNRSFRPVKKTLLLNLDELGLYTDNLEGITFGPVLPNGNKTLLLIADNNFSEQQRSQLLLFEVLEK